MRSKLPELNVGIFLLLLFSCFHPQLAKAWQGAPQKDTATKEIRGSVSDTTAPMVGVAVTVKGRPGIGTQTDINGKYILMCPQTAWYCNSVT